MAPPSPEVPMAALPVGRGPPVAGGRVGGPPRCLPAEPSSKNNRWRPAPPEYPRQPQQAPRYSAASSSGCPKTVIAAPEVSNRASGLLPGLFFSWPHLTCSSAITHPSKQSKTGSARSQCFSAAPRWLPIPWRRCHWPMSARRHRSQKRRRIPCNDRHRPPGQ